MKFNGLLCFSLGILSSILSVSELVSDPFYDWDSYWSVISCFWGERVSFGMLFLDELSINVIDIPLFKNANSLILFSKIEGLNFIEEKISLEGKKVI